MKGGETMDLKKLEKNLKARGFDYYYATDAEDAVRHILEQVQNTSVGIGGSTTADQLGLYDRLTETNQVHWHWKEGPKPEVYQAAAEAEVYISGVNGLAESGEVVNIDGKGNRVAALSYAVGKRIFLVAGRNKVCPDLPAAIERARNVAAPKNLLRFPGTRPCTDTQKCWDCRSKDRSCCTMQIMMFKPMQSKKVELILIDEDLGY